MLLAQRRLQVGSLAFVAALLRWTSALAQPQAASVLTVAGGAVSEGAGVSGLFRLGARADLLFFRSRDREMGLGPFVGASAENFRATSVAGGLDWLVPVSVDFPFRFSAGGFGQFGDGRARAGFVGGMLWGARGHNFEGHYDLSFGAFVEGRYSPEALGSVVGGLEIDLSVFTYPFLLAWGALAH